VSSTIEKKEKLFLIMTTAFPHATMSVSYSELTLFLSKNKNVQVRAHITAKQKTVFCVKDFIRQTANRKLSPDDSLLCWLYALGKLSHEDAILDNIAVQFAGPYEKPNICIGAEGLLILYHFMGEDLKLVNEEYRTEVQDILMDIVSSKNHDQHILMHDDGEIQEILSEMGDEKWVCPPPDSKFHFIPTVHNENGDEEPFDAVLKRHIQTEIQLRETVKGLEAKNSELSLQLETFTEPMLELKQLKAANDRKRMRCEGVCVQELCTELALDIPEMHMATLCKKVINTFKADYPDNETFLKHKKTYFYLEDKDLITDLLNEEHLQLQLWMLDNEAMEVGKVGSEI